MTIAISALKNFEANFTQPAGDSFTFGANPAATDFLIFAGAAFNGGGTQSIQVNDNASPPNAYTQSLQAADRYGEGKELAFLVSAFAANLPAASGLLTVNGVAPDWTALHAVLLKATGVNATTPWRFRFKSSDYRDSTGGANGDTTRSVTVTLASGATYVQDGDRPMLAFLIEDFGGGQANTAISVTSDIVGAVWSTHYQRQDASGSVPAVVVVSGEVPAGQGGASKTITVNFTVSGAAATSDDFISALSGGVLVPATTTVPPSDPGPVTVDDDAPWPSPIYVESVIAGQRTLPTAAQTIHPDYGYIGYTDSWPHTRVPSIKALTQSPGASEIPPFVDVSDWATNYANRAWPGVNVFSANGDVPAGQVGNVTMEAKLTHLQGLRIDNAAWEVIDNYMRLKARRKFAPWFTVNGGELVDFAVDEDGDSVCRFLPEAGLTTFEINRREDDSARLLSDPLNYRAHFYVTLMRLQPLTPAGALMIASGDVKKLAVPGMDFATSLVSYGPRGDGVIDGTFGGPVVIDSTEWTPVYFISVESVRKEMGEDQSAGWPGQPIPIQWPAGTAENPGAYGALLDSDAIANPPLFVYSASHPVPSGGTGGTGGSTNALTVPSSGTVASAASAWRQWKDTPTERANHLVVASGTALDFSSIFNAPANSLIGPRGHGVNWPGYLLPTAAEVDLFVANIQRRGHKFIRFHLVDAWFFDPNDSAYPNASEPMACWYNASRRDAFWRLLAKLSAGGVKYAIGIHMATTGMVKGSSGPFTNPNDAAESIPLRVQLGTDTDAENHWRWCVDALLGLTNPYFPTAKSVLQDSNFVAFETLNESNLEGMTFGFMPMGQYNHYAVIAPSWHAWQTANLGSVLYPFMPAAQSGASTQAFARWMVDMMNQSTQWMKAYVQSKGFAGYIVGNNFVPNNMTNIVRAESYTCTDIHAYADLSDTGTAFFNRSMIEDRMRWFLTKSAAMIKGKPTMVSEHSVGSANQFGYEYWLTHALAAMNDHDYMAQFSHADSALNYDDNRVWFTHFERKFFAGHDMTKDSVAMACNRIGAFLFGRGDLRRSVAELGVVLRKSAVFADGTPWWNTWPRNIVLAALVMRVRTINEAHVNGSLAYVGPGTTPSRIIDPHNSSTDMNRSLDTLIGEMKASGIIPASNSTNDASGIYESDTGELLIHANNRAARVKTDRSHVLCWDAKANIINTPLVTVEDATPKAVLGVHDRDDNSTSLVTSNRILLIHAGENRGSNENSLTPVNIVATGGSDALYENEVGSAPTYKIVSDIGEGNHFTRLPIFHRGNIAVVRLALATGNWTLYRLDISGNRVETLPTQRLPDGTVRVVLDNTQSGPLLQSVYYELRNSSIIIGGNAGGAASAASTVTVTDQSGSTIPASSVTLSTNEPGATINGYTITHGTTAGTYTLTATFGSLTSTVTYAVTATAAPSLTVQSIAAAQPGATSTLTVIDESGASVTTGLTVTTNEPGASVAGLFITHGTTPGTYTVTVTDGVSTSTRNYVVNVAAVEINIVQPISAVAGQTSTIIVVDGSGAPITSGVTLSTNEPGATVAGLTVTHGANPGIFVLTATYGASSTAAIYTTVSQGSTTPMPLIVSVESGTVPLRVQGTGIPGAVIDFRIDGGTPSEVTINGVTTVTADGTWSVTLSTSPGPHVLEARQTPQ